MSFWEECERTRDITPQSSQQAEWIIRRYAKRAGNCGALSFFWEKPAAYRLTHGIAAGFGLFWKGVR
jgi:hypothetical protein